METAYWNPAVVTDKEGKARITFKAPSALSEYRITARGVTGADTLAGQTSATLTVRKSFFVDLKVPGALTQGDKPRFIAQVHHTGIQGTAALRLAIYAGGRDDVFPRTVELKGDGVEEITFEPFEVPEGDSARLTLTGAVGEVKDELIVEIPIHPWGVPVFASASGTGSESTTVFVGLPAGRTYENPDMLIAISPSLRRMLIELALGSDAPAYRNVLSSNSTARILPPPTNTTADRAAELLSATSALRYLRDARATTAPEAQRLTERIQGLVAELTAAQYPGRRLALGLGRSGSGWPAGNRPPALPSDRLTSASVLWSLATAEPLGLLADPKTLDLAVAHLNQEFSKIGGNDLETRAALLHALSTCQRAASSRGRQQPESIEEWALRLRLSLPGADLRQPGSRLDGRRATWHPGSPGQDRGDRSGPSRAAVLGSRGPFAFHPVRRRDHVTCHSGLHAGPSPGPRARPGQRLAGWLHRVANGWLPHKAKGPAMAALASYYGRAQNAEDRYRLTVTVNDTQVAVLDVAGPVEEKVIAVPRAALKLGQANHIRFAMEGRGQFGYATTLSAFTREFGPDQDRTNRVAWIDRRVYYPAPPELDGKALPVGFGVAVHANTFENLATQVALGGRAQVAITAFRNIPGNAPGGRTGFPRRAGVSARVYHPDRRLGADIGLVSRAGRRCVDPLLPARCLPGHDPLRRLRLCPRELPHPARLGAKRLRAGPLPPRPGRRVPRPFSRRAEHGSLQADARRALRPRQGPVRRRPVRRGRRRPSNRSSAATASRRTSPRTPRACCS